MKRILIALAFSLLSVVAYSDDRNYLIVLDSSGSMGDRMGSDRTKTRMDVAHRALIDVLATLPAQGTNVGIYTFEGWAYPIQPLDHTKINTAIVRIRPLGGTPLFNALKEGTTQFLQFRQQKANTGYYKVIVITDGVADDSSLNREGTFGDGSVKLGVLKDIMMRGLVIDTIGLDMSGDHPLSTEINGAYMRGDDPNSLTQSISKAVAEIAVADGDTSGFEEIKSLPDVFAIGAIKGLTAFQNHPIGEKPYVAVVSPNGTYTMQPQAEEKSKTCVICMLVVAVVVITVVIVSVIIANNRGRY